MKLYELKHLETLRVTYFLKAFYLNMITADINSISYVSLPHIFNAFGKNCIKLIQISPHWLYGPGGPTST